MHKSVFIILAWGTLFHQVHDSTEERRRPQPDHISSNQTFQGGGEEKKNEWVPSNPRIMLPDFM